MQFVDEVIKAYPGDQNVVERFDLVDVDGVVVATGVKLVRRNEVIDEGTPLDAATFNDVETRISAAQATADSGVTKANAAQSTANAAQGSASSAQSTANAALPKAGGTMTGMITLPGNPSSTNHAANKAYVDAAASAVQSTANAAQNTASAAQSTANAAQSTADAAQSTASGALQRTGGTMTGAITLPGNPSSSNHAANKAYVDAVNTKASSALDSASAAQSTANAALPKAGGTMTGAITLPATTPSADNHATRKRYVDDLAGAKLNLTGGTLTGAAYAGGSQAVGTAQIRNIRASTTDLTAGSSALPTGQVYLVYE